MPLLTEFEKYPTTRYQGSKRKILAWLYENLKDIDFTTVLDACGGTASVSYLLKQMGKQVTYNDILKFNHLIGKALVENQTITISEDDLNYILNSEPEPDASTFISETFDGIYYITNENQWLDKIIYRIHNMQAGHPADIEIKKAMCFYALFQACLRKRPFNLFHRKNLHIRTADVKRNFGNKATWEREFSSEFRLFINELNASVFDSGINCESLNQSAFELENNYDLVYFDVPYISQKGGNETSNYLNCYHFLEGMASYDVWNENVDYLSKTRRFKVGNNNPFTKETIYNSLDLLFERFQDSILVFSYKIGGIPSVEEIETLMRKYKPHTEIKSKHYKYALNKQNGNAKFNREVLIIGTNG